MNFKTKLETFLFYFKRKHIIAQYKIFNYDEWLNCSIESIHAHVYKILIVESNFSWDASQKKRPDNQEKLIQLKNLYPNKIILISGDWNNQLDQVNAGLNYIKKNIPEATHMLYIDSDEVYSDQEIKKLVNLVMNWKYFNREIRINMYTYFKSPFYRIDPPEPFKPMVLFPIRNFVQFTNIRCVNLAFVEKEIWMHHLSYVRKNLIDIRTKMLTHKDDEGTSVSWYDDVYLKWTPQSKNFHPKEPKIFKGIKILDRKEVLPEILSEYESWNK